MSAKIHRDKRISTQSTHSGYGRFPGKESKKKMMDSVEDDTSFLTLFDELLTIDVEKLKPLAPMVKKPMKRGMSKLSRTNKRNRGTTLKRLKGSTKKRDKVKSSKRLGTKKGKNNKSNMSGLANISKASFKEDTAAVVAANASEPFKVPKFEPPSTIINTVLELPPPKSPFIAPVVPSDAPMGTPPTIIPPPVNFGKKEPKMLPKLRQQRAELERESERSEIQLHKTKSKSTPVNIGPSKDLLMIDPEDKQKSLIRRSEIPSSSASRLNDSMSSRTYQKQRTLTRKPNEIARLQSTMTRRKNKKGPPPGLIQSNRSVSSYESHSKSMRRPPGLHQSSSSIGSPSPPPLRNRRPPPGMVVSSNYDGPDEIKRLQSTMTRRKKKPRGDLEE